MGVAQRLGSGETLCQLPAEAGVPNVPAGAVDAAADLLLSRSPPERLSSQGTTRPPVAEKGSFWASSPCCGEGAEMGAGQMGGLGKRKGRQESVQHQWSASAPCPHLS